MSSIIEEILREADEHYDGQRIKDAVIGLYYTFVELDDGSGGLSYTNTQGGVREDIYKNVIGADSKEISKLLFSSRGLEVSLGAATVNALLNKKDNINNYFNLDILELVEFSEEDNVVLIGYFKIYIDKLKNRVNSITVVEINRVIDEEVEVYPWWAYNVAFKNATKIIISGSTISNHTIDYLIKSLPSNAQTIIVGPTTSLAKKTFKKHGISLIGTALVKKPEKCKEIVKLGGGAKRIFREGCAEKIAVKL